LRCPPLKTCTTLPVPANATPAIYSEVGREFVVVTVEGSEGRRSDSKGSRYIAFDPSLR
jgi:hypothetical protein